MGTFNGQEFGKEVVAIVTDYLERTLAPMAARIEQLESRLLLVEGQVGATKAKPTIRIAAGSGPAT
ncbi:MULTISPECIES: hypothetical protein [Rhizobium]|uniref:hypothetical protein n=1 Tax=Rhizobium TaxID=379 RepID=UPI0009900C94|nr:MULTISPECIES: hypothetical protein [Rhizobium]MBB5255584.1 hypothetical protein [Rhizobium leguminosarum]MDX6000916.1 hypothetical protein [Rhizobium leguminosarum]NEJ06244.1 hypothetical protein [Rhizobium ruizarguesonis]OOO44394.1 hypothetical protein BS629_30185 [Rhizobium leguminosarum bv. viciae USDA 2370]PUB62873.1 hypothetical protein DB728_14065 [Rhizobium leguminosarum bv. viciae USDA 2370]